MATAPKISYVARDFSSNKQALIDYIREQFPQDWTDFFDSNLGVALLELASYDFTILSYMLDKQANESYLPTAMLRENVIKLLNLIDYNLTPATAASVDVDAWLSAAIGDATTIRALTRVTSADGLTFEVDKDYTIPAGSTTPLSVIVPSGTGATFTAGSYTVTFATELSALVFPGMHIKGLGTHQDFYRISSIAADRLSLELTDYWNPNGLSEAGIGYYVEDRMITLVEGETRNQTFASDGTAGQRFQCSFGPVISGSIVVTVNNVVWTEIDNLVYSAGGNNYELDYDAFDKVTVIFGDGISGAIPPLGANISVTYRIRSEERRVGKEC
jgi:hypothetical protein